MAEHVLLLWTWNKSREELLEGRSRWCPGRLVGLFLLGGLSVRLFGEKTMARL